MSRYGILIFFLLAFTVRRELLESLVPLKKKRRRSLSQLIPAETLSQFLLNLPSHAASQVNNAVANKLNNNDSEERMKNGVNTTGLLFGTPSQSLGAPPPASNTTHGTSAGFCNICQKFVSNRTNHKYVHSQVSRVTWVKKVFILQWFQFFKCAFFPWPF